MSCGPTVEDQGATGDTDGRTPVVVSPAAREAVRMEMRQMLAALNGTLTVLMSGDSQKVMEAARGGGTAIAVDVDPAIRDRLPEEFVRLGMSTHQGFDSVAAAAETGAPVDTMVARLGRLTRNCLACHQSYRLEVK